MTPRTDGRRRSKQAAAKIRDSDVEAIAKSQASDYDGHTEFANLTASQRLEWLEHAAAFVETAIAERKKPER
jgi:hypothetical protein